MTNNTTEKIHYSLEDPISHLFYYISDLISPSLYRIGITPNMITFIRLIMGITAFTYFFKNKMYQQASILYILAYFGDCLDGHLARKYKMDTLIGDYLDNFTDGVILIISIFYITTNMTHNKQNEYIISILIVIFLISLIQIGCQERYIELHKISDNPSRSYDILKVKYLCPKSYINDDEIESTIEFTRLFGIGLYHLLVSLVIWNFNKLV